MDAPLGFRLLVLLGCYGVLHYLYFQIPDAVFREVYHHGLGSVCAHLINLMSPVEKVSAFANHLASARADLEIVRGCDGAGAVFLVMSAVAAFPASIRRKLTGAALGIALMYVLNLLRVVGLYFVIAYQRDWFQLVHTYFAPTLIIVAGCLYFAWWASGSVRLGDEPC